MKRFFIIVCLAMAGCQTGPSHIPPWYQLPSTALGSVIENNNYKQRRNKVKASIQPHLDFILTDADLGGGVTFNMTCEVASVSAVKCAELAREISANPQIYKTGDTAEKVEKLTVTFMVYGS